MQAIRNAEPVAIDAEVRDLLTKAVAVV